MRQTDAELVQRVLDGDVTAFADLYDRYARLVRAICFDFCTDFATAEDLGQDVFLRAYRHLSSLRDADRFGPWLVTIARRVGSSWQQKRQREARHRQPMMAAAAQRAVTFDVAVDEQDQQAYLLRLLTADAKLNGHALLSDDERLALHVRFVQACDVRQACELVGCSQSTYYRLLSAALTKLRTHLQRSEVKWP